ncbi:hypothetical protein K470DRAFT_258025 [Piedraia hortae CBS 480.64]|uniref:Uncharacterized protein n=1 Tax=Piedraia hortae CBS 480.64 TaxID=1314780 RepID=A0A6A7BY19_9PEZI|nr:hypothetical protein K470DRAFT_258025 [Piedraia hortae CBS 480.64]
MSLNFAPYQSSPEPDSPQHTQNSSTEDPWAAARAQPLPLPSRYHDSLSSGYSSIDGVGRETAYSDLEPGSLPSTYYGSSSNAKIYNPSLPLPLGVEAALAYLLFPPAGAIVLLLFERKSDYVRFHAWQALLLILSLGLVHLVLAWTVIGSWILFALDMLLLAYLAFRAYRDSLVLDRVEVPVIGPVVNRWVG